MGFQRTPNNQDKEGLKIRKHIRITDFTPRSGVYYFLQIEKYKLIKNVDHRCTKTCFSRQVNTGMICLRQSSKTSTDRRLNEVLIITYNMIVTQNHSV